MTTIESGTAQGIDYVPEETRAVAIHEAGHAAASHVYMKDVLSTRLSIRKRGGSLGHHQAIEKEERFSSWRSRGDRQADLDAGRDGRRARVLRRELHRRRRRRAERHGARGLDGRLLRHGPRARSTLNGRFAKPEDEEAEREKLMKRFERIGAADHEPHRRRRTVRRPTRSPACSATRDDRAAAAQLLGQAYLTAHA